ncbi:MAG: hypothetical protein SV760_09795 [Halobacteria archaeon]|nr:hypothetical protein [Halobacteria archaeon]
MDIDWSIDELEKPDLKHPSWLTALGTAVSYTLLLVGMFVLLFVIPFLVFEFL